VRHDGVQLTKTHGAVANDIDNNRLPLVPNRSDCSGKRAIRIAKSVVSHR